MVRARPAKGLAVLLGATLALTTGCARPSAPLAPAPVRQRVVLIVVDGLDARDVRPGEAPVLARWWREASWCPRVRGRAAMPARTNVNHATLVTGVHPEVHGITGNAYWARTSAPAGKLGAAPHLLVETIFTVARRARPERRTAAALGKGKLAWMFAATAAGQAAPNEVWGPSQASVDERDAITGYARDHGTLRHARAMLERTAVDFLLVNLADVDRVSHGAGPASQAARAARRRSDAAIAEFVEFLQADEAWPRTTVVITADHGFDTIRHPPLRFAEVARRAGLEGLVSVGDGGVAHVYLRTRDDPARAAALLAAARRIALATPGIAQALYLDPNGMDGGDAHTLGAVHPTWRLRHERTGDLLLVAAAGYVLGDGAGGEAHLRGNHGGPRDRDVPIIVIRDGKVSARTDCHDVALADLGRTVLACLGLRDVERLDGAAIPPDGRGRVLVGLCR